jgi:C-terminal processing protease CtpA/Prc
MYISSKLATGRVLAFALAITLWGLGVPTLQARGAQKGCTAQETQCPVDPHAQHEAEEARQRALANQQMEAEHAQHEAAEACERRQKAYSHAPHEAQEAQERATHKLEKANALAANTCKASETVAEAQPQPEPEIIRAKPTLGTVEIRGIRVASLSAQNGVIVADVQIGTPASDAGLKSGDIILDVDGHTVHTADEFLEFMRQLNNRHAAFNVRQRNGQINVFVIPS